MKRLLLTFSVTLLLGLTACVQPPPTAVPAETIAMAAPATVTPLPTWTPSDTPVPATLTLVPTDTPIPATDTPEPPVIEPTAIVTDTAAPTAVANEEVSVPEATPESPTEPFFLYFYADW